jgi:hypothetical protein
MEGGRSPTGISKIFGGSADPYNEFLLLNFTNARVTINLGY